MPPTPKKSAAKPPRSVTSGPAVKKAAVKKSDSVGSKHSTPKASTAPGLALTDLHLRLAGLEADNEKLLKLIGRKRKEIDNFIAEAQEVGREVVTKGRPFYGQIEDLDTEIHQAFTKIFTTRKMGKNAKSMVEDVYFYLQSNQIITINPNHRPRSFMEEMMEEILGEMPNIKPPKEDPSDTGNYYDVPDKEPLNHKIDRTESRKIRQVFLRLAAVFHPDKLPDESKKEEYEEVMKEVNLAYQRGDLAALLQIEKQHDVGAVIDLNNSDDLTMRCGQLAREHDLLKEQQIAVKQELREVKKSEPGQMLTQYRKMRKHGIDPIETLVQEAQVNLDNSTILRDFVQSFLDKKITVDRFSRGPKFRRADGREYLDEDDLADMVVNIFDPHSDF